MVLPVYGDRRKPAPAPYTHAACEGGADMTPRGEPYAGERPDAVCDQAGLYIHPPRGEGCEREKTNPEDEFGNIPRIPAGKTVIILCQLSMRPRKRVQLDLILPKPTRILQKQGMNQVVSDYFESQKKRLPFSKAVIAEQAIANFKVNGNRTLWAGRAGKFKASVAKMGMQHVTTPPRAFASSSRGSSRSPEVDRGEDYRTRRRCFSPARCAKERDAPCRQRTSGIDPVRLTIESLSGDLDSRQK